ncbi:Receptor protein 12 [Spatholobus suberectus]|nr:Receptor protein 12 [Spatholobus suberectus]
MESWMGWLVVCWHLLLFHFSSSHSLCHPHENFALLQFNASFSINTIYYDDPSYYGYLCHDVYPKTATWENGTDCCSWLGVTCHPISGHVIGLDLTCSGLQGKIHPNSTLFCLSHLQSLNLAFNDFSNSQLSSLFGGFVSLKHLNLSDSTFKGTDVSGKLYTDSMTITTKAISMTFSKIPIKFVNIDLSRNKFKGEIPNAIGELHALKGLNLSHNRLSGPIPQSMGNLTNLESLDLSSNMLTGRIPTELTNLNFLEFLNLSHNHLVGEIPQGKQFNTFMNDSYEGNLGLCGLPLSKKCGKDPEQHSPHSLTFWGEERFGFGWKPVAIGYGCGMVFGVGIGCCVFLIGKPRWLVRLVGGLLN